MKCGDRGDKPRGQGLGLHQLARRRRRRDPAAKIARPSGTLITGIMQGWGGVEKEGSETLEGSNALGKLVTVCMWDGNVTCIQLQECICMRVALELEAAAEDRKLLTLSDSQAASTAVRKREKIRTVYFKTDDWQHQGKGGQTDHTYGSKPIRGYNVKEPTDLPGWEQREVWRPIITETEEYASFG